MFCWFTALVALAIVTTSGMALAIQGEATLSQLSKVRLDKTQIYSVRDITINRDVLSISLNRGAIAFTEAIEGKVTGAVFIGSGGHSAGRHRKETAVPVHQVGSVERTFRDGRLSFHGRDLGGDSEGNQRSRARNR